MADMFGAPIGISQAGRDMDAQAMNAMNFLGKAEDLADAPVKREMSRQHARLYGAQADEKVREAATRERIMSQLAAGKSGGAEDPLEEQERLGQLLIQAGSWKEGSEMIARVATTRARNSRAVNQEAAAELAIVRTSIAQQTLASNWASSIRNQRDLDDALMSAQGLSFNTEVIPRNFEEAKPVLERLAREGITANQAAQIRLRELETGIRLSERDDQQRTRETVREVNRARVRSLEQGVIDRQRNAGRTVVNREDIAEAQDFLKDRFKGMDYDANELRVVSADMAHGARQRLRNNPALTYTQALAQEFQSGDWEISEPWGKIPFKDKVAVRGSAKLVRGTRPGTALSMPTTVDGKLDRGKLIKDRHYISPRGIGRWNGTGFELAGPRGAVEENSPDGGGMGGDDEEDDD